MSEGGHHAGVIALHAGTPQVISGLDTFHKQSDIFTQIDSATGWVSDIGKALDLARTDLFGKSPRRYTRKVLVVLMFGGFTSTTLQAAASSLHDEGVLVISVGVNINSGDASYANLELMANDPAGRPPVFTGQFMHLTTIMNIINVRYFLGKYIDDITRLHEDIKFSFEWWKQYSTYEPLKSPYL